MIFFVPFFFTLFLVASSLSVHLTLFCLLSFVRISFSLDLLQTPEELDDSDFETEDFDVRSRTSVQTEDDQLIGGKSARVSLLLCFC